MINIIKQLFKNKTEQPPIIHNWKNYVKDNPTYEDFKSCWFFIFNVDFNNCKIMLLEDKNDNNKGFFIETDEKTIMHGGFTYYTVYPILEDEDSDELYYDCGCDFGIDDNYERYYKIDKTTGLPINLNSAISKEIIKNYIINNYEKVNVKIKGKKVNDSNELINC